MTGVFAAATGLCVGSFGNVVVARLPKGEGLVWRGSHCPRCNRPLRWFHNIPLLGWVFLQGRCAFCRGRISARYPLVEAWFGLLFWLLAGRRGWDGQGIYFLFFFCAISLLALLDWETMRLEDRYTLPLALAGLSGSFLFPGLYGGRSWASPEGAAGLFLAMLFISWLGRALFRREAMGGGDVKFMAAAGGFLGLEGGLLALGTAYVAGALFSVAWLARGGSRKDPIPFGPFLAAGCLVAGLDLLSGGHLSERLLGILF